MRSGDERGESIFSNMFTINMPLLTELALPRFRDRLVNLLNSLTVPRRSARVFAFVALLVLLVTAPARAWNSTGHMAIAELAWRRLSHTERTAATALLREHPHYALLLATNMPPGVSDTNEWVFLRAATWPDLVRPTRTGSPPKPKFITEYHRADWHYTNSAFVLARDLGAVNPPASGEGKLLEAIAANEKTLKDKTRSARERAVALCWLLHLVGDLHQPLHCVAWFSPEFPKGDRGGNGVAIRPGAAAIVLHAYWDDILGVGEDPLSIEQVTARIAGSAERLKKELQHTTVAEWAQESIIDAEASVYLGGKLAHAKVPGSGIKDLPDEVVPALNTGYETNAEIVAARRAALAGHRLGEMLKSCF